MFHGQVKLGILDAIPDANMAPLIQFYNLGSKEFFCTVDVLEIKDLQGNQWVQDEVLGYVFVSEMPDTVSLYGTCFE